jgi:hypothetical protein
MPHALSNRNTGICAEAESLATNLSASALSTRLGVNNSEDTQTHRAGRKPPPRLE